MDIARFRKRALVLLVVATSAMSTFGKSPPPPPPTLQEKVSASPYIVLGQVERVNYVGLTGPRTFKLLDYLPQDFDKGEQAVLSIKVLEVLKEVDQNPVTTKVSLFYSESSGTREAFRERNSPGSEWVFFMRPSEGHLKSEPPEFFGEAPEFRIPHYRQRVVPEPLKQLDEIRKLLSSRAPSKRSP